MDQPEFEARVRALKSRAHGRWTEILRALGVDERLLTKKNMPCPFCGGTDRFQYTDKYGEGNYHCRACGAGGGLKLAQHQLQVGFGELLQRLEALVGSVPSGSATIAGPAPARMRKLAQRLWAEARPIVAGDEADRYLASRGLRLDVYPRSLRLHPALGYYDKVEGKSRRVGEHPALLGCVQGSDGHGVTLHRIYLRGGTKAPVPDAKKTLSSGINGAAVRLGEPGDELGITEGVETGLAALCLSGKPVWAALSCHNMEKLWVPETVRLIHIYSDNDADAHFDGQASAYALARRLKKQAKTGAEREVFVHVPKRPGWDFADVWADRLAGLRQAA